MPRLRNDKVVRELMDRLRTGLRDDVPAGTVVLLTVTAPIRQSGKTAVALEETIRALLRQDLPMRDSRKVVHENSVRIRIVRGAPEGAPPVMGFVHNPDVDPKRLLDAVSMSPAEGKQL